jgi:hypothetical protein
MVGVLVRAFILYIPQTTSLPEAVHVDGNAADSNKASITDVTMALKDSSTVTTPPTADDDVDDKQKKSDAATAAPAPSKSGDSADSEPSAQLASGFFDGLRLISASKYLAMVCDVCVLVMMMVGDHRLH